MLEYKVMSQKDRWFAGKFDPDQLEKGLNAYAQEGWACKAVATATVPGVMGNREEIIFILEREKP